MDEPATAVEVLGHTASVESVAWSPDGRLIASAGYDGRIFIWQADALLDGAAQPAP